MLTTLEIIEVMDKLENSFCQTIGSFMQRQFGFDWDKEKILIELYDILNKTMVKEEEQHKNGYTMISWIPR